MSGARASPSLLALSCLYIHLLSIVPHPSPPETILLCTCRRRPLNCGYVPRARRYTGIIISSFRSHSIIPPRTLRSSGLCTIPTIDHRYLSHLFINNPPILCPHAPHPTMSRSERLITVSFLRPPPPPTFSSIHTFSPDELHCETLKFYTVSRWTTVVALDIACLQEHLTWCRSVHRLWEGIDWRSEWIRKTVLHLELSRTLPTLPDTTHRSRPFPPTQLSNRGMPVTPDPMTESVEAWTFEQCAPSATTVKPFEWPNAVRVRLRSRILVQIRRQTFTLPYALYALVH
jgi:hypothetical protein